MSVKSYTYISFPGTAKDAFEYYHSIFGGELEILTYGQFPEGMASEFPLDLNPDAVANATLVSDVISLAGGDAMDESAPGLDGTPYSLLLIAEDEAEGRHYWDAFLDTGGEVVLPLELAPWGELYGHVRDRFGISWAINVSVS